MTVPPAKCSTKTRYHHHNRLGEVHVHLSVSTVFAKLPSGRAMRLLQHVCGLWARAAVDRVRLNSGFQEVTWIRPYLELQV